MNLVSLLKPSSVAVIGAGDKPGTFGGDTCKNVIDYMDSTKVFFVNPKRESVFGRHCYADLADLPQNIEQVILCTPKSTVIPLLREAAAKGAKSAVVYASGYKETGENGKADEQALYDVAKELDMAVMGPNCGGFINFVDNIYSFAFISAKRDRLGGVGLVSQSGQICLSALDTPNMRLSYAISAGNCGIVGMEDYFEYLVEDPDTKVIAMFLEGVSQPEKMIRAMEKAALVRKPVVIQKVGRSEKGSVTAASHTGSLSGADAAFDALFKKYGVIRADDFQDLISTSLTLATWTSLPEIATAASMNFSGGETGMCADVGDIMGIEYPDFAPQTIERLKKVLPPYATPRNPLDTTVTVAYETDTYQEVVQAVMDDPNIGVVLIGYTLLNDIVDPCIYYMYEALERVYASGNATKPAVLLPFGENSRNPEYLEKLSKLSVPILPPPLYGLNCIRHIMDYVRYDASRHTLRNALPSKQLNREASRTLSEYDSMQMLSEAGIRTPRGGIARTADQAVQLAMESGLATGGRVVMKVSSADIPHKTDAGGVKLGLDSEESVRQAFAEILDNCYKAVPGAVIDGIFVQEMLAKGLEVIVGVNNDPQWGPQILCGLGGIFVEVFKDVSLYSAPFGLDEATDMIRSLNAFKLFDGYRGALKLDVPALAQTLVTISEFAARHCDELLELDLNPVIVYPEGQGVCAADALIVLSKEDIE